ncbi:hypothetical protein JRO89_XSUnG0128800 [Xanthoceras sorbifolium]|uniref:EGF-like domain-containing protein n=1 Tax=Xanthoceras sorbifolium TaxID=99658 RepID=A0ABQ8GY97_9ROSI|nr:hypothetical protein JRO89_XSUnG0128800 [Xanthoceras sorbifolium]
MAGMLPGVGVPHRRRPQQQLHRQETSIGNSDISLRERREPSIMAAMDETALRARLRLEQRLAYLHSSSRSSDRLQDGGNGPKRKAARVKDSRSGTKFLRMPWNFQLNKYDVCKKVECGKGKCKASQNSTVFYECECDPGTLNSDCTAAPPPVQEKATKANESIIDPCHWADCGGGSCNKTSPFTYSCECAEGYFNLFNVSAFSCYKECSIGLDCANLGISMSNKSTSPTPAFADSGKNQAGSNFLGKYHWYHGLIVLVMSLAVV